MTNPTSVHLTTLWIRRSASALGLVVALVASSAIAADPFREQIVPFLTTYCQECHNATKSEGQLNLTRYNSTAAMADDFRQWEHVVTFLKSQEMPPESARQPSEELRAKVLQVLSELMIAEGRKLAGDPGVVLPRRLSNAEYDNTIRDLTGVDIRPADSFPIDPAAGEGFTNTGEALSMSPSLFKKYFAAAQYVSEHVDFTPGGWSFAAYPVATYADQKKLHEQAILDFYARHDVDYEAYLRVAWTYRGLPTENRPSAEAWAQKQGLSSKYFRSLWDFLSGDAGAVQFFARSIRQRWQTIPKAAADANGLAGEAESQLRSLARDLKRMGTALCHRETPAIVSNAGNGPIEHIDRRTKTATSRDTFSAARLIDSQRFHLSYPDLQKSESIALVLKVSPFAGADGADGFVVLKDLNFSAANPDSYNPKSHDRNTSLLDLLQKHAPEKLEALKVGLDPAGNSIEPGTIALAIGSSMELTVPTSAFPKEKSIHFYVDARLDREHTKSGMLRFSLLKAGSNASDEFEIPLVNPDHPVAEQLRKSCEPLCQLFPNRFYYVDETRGLSAGFHLIEGFFRDDQPLCRHVLSDDENRELDRLWNELAFGTQIAEKMLRGFVFFERSERNFMKHPDFDSFKEEDPELATVASVERLEQAYFRRMNFKGTDEQRAQHPIHLFFAGIRDGLEQRAAQLKAAEPAYVQKLERFAESAYRRPLTPDELQQLKAFYLKLAGQEEFGIEKGIRASIIRILVSPHFCYRIDPAPVGKSVQPLSDLALASRLSYFLWSSQPDDELMSVAKAGRLRDEAVLRAQTRRMLKDPKVSGFALEFFGQWLRYRDFLEQESVSRAVFPSFDDKLKQAMFEEPTRMASHLINHDRQVIELLSSDVTVVNQRLAQHYGMPVPGSATEWQEVSGLHAQGRSGILGMAAFLTRNSQPQRTSPVKRGFWVVHHLLGEHIPTPPADVVALPAKETDTNGKTIRQLMVLHTDDHKCARCHQRFDAVGLAMEGFDAIGRSRTKDLAGRPVDNLVKLPTGAEAHGIPEFSQYLASARADDFHKTLSRKLLGYALGRSLQLSDQPLLDVMQARLREDGRFGTLFETVVLSPQFRNQRCRDFSVEQFRIESSGD